MKNPFMSKMVWLGILQIAVAVADYVAAFEGFDSEFGWKSIALFASGLATIILRWLSAQPISGFGFADSLPMRKQIVDRHQTVLDLKNRNNALRSKVVELMKEKEKP